MFVLGHGELGGDLGLKDFFSFFEGRLFRERAGEARRGKLEMEQRLGRIDAISFFFPSTPGISWAAWEPR